MSTSSRAVRTHLRQVAAAERSKTFAVVAWARFAIVFIYTLSTLYYVVFTDNVESRRTIFIFLAYTLFALIVALGSRIERLHRTIGWTFALLDIPAMTAAAWIAVPLNQTDSPVYFLVAALPYMCAAIVISVLAIDLSAIIAAGVSALIGTALLLHRLDAGIDAWFDPLFGVFSVAMACCLVVWRLRSVVEESRRKDFAGKYVLGNRLGAGGMAEVFEATYSPAGGFERKVAVKRVLPSWANDPDFIALFRREAEVGAQLAHPNLVQVLDYGKHLESWFIAMEFVEGVSLSVVLRELSTRAEVLPLDVATYVIAQVAEAVTYLQERPNPDGTGVGLVHRDLNPPNVLLSRAGEVKVSDYGVARWADSKGLTQTGAVRGKLAYLAPEQLRGAPPATAGDQFSLGVMAWEILTGKKLFVADNEAELVRLVLEAPLHPPSSLRPSVPPEVDAIVMGLLERDPANRIVSSRAVTRVLGGLTGTAAPYPHGRAALVSLLQAFEVGPASVPEPPAPLVETKTTPSKPPG